jgi:flagellar motor switch protein FliM
MAEVLSQQEIDQLLNNIKTGGEKPSIREPEKEALPYDFRLPNRISKNQLRTIRSFHENFAEGLSSFLMTKLQSILNINVVSVDQIYYSEYVLSVSNPGCLFTFDMRGTDIKGILELSSELAIILVDKFLGGNGKGTKHTKVITPIEQKVLYLFVEKVMQELKKSWHVIGNFDFVVDRFESDIDFAQITSQSESVLIVSFEVNISETPCLMNICFATYAFDSILSKLNSQNFTSIRPQKYMGTTAKNIIAEQLKEAEIPVAVEFGTANISVDEMINLELGDLILTNKKIGDEMIVRYDNQTLFYGQAGIVNGHKAIRVTKDIELLK